MRLGILMGVLCAGVACSTGKSEQSVGADGALGTTRDASRPSPEQDAAEGPTVDAAQASCYMSCDDGEVCTSDTCIEGVCMHTSTSTCPWPAESAEDATNLSEIPGSTQCVFGVNVVKNDFSKNLSGSVWNPESETLWLVVNDPGTLFAVVPNGDDWAMAEQGGVEANWELEGLGDVEAVTQVDYSQEHLVYTLNEGAHLQEWDTSDFSEVRRVHTWYLPEIDNGNKSGEGLSFVPDAALAAQGFVDANGNAYTSTLGMGGLMFVGFERTGELIVYDLDPNDDEGVILVGRYRTAHTETAALEFDRSTGLLYIWHGDELNMLEVASLASTEDDGVRTIQSQATYASPELSSGMSDNIEGMAIAPIGDCVEGRRRLWLATDGGECFSLAMYQDFPC